MAVKILNGVDVVGNMNITASDVPNLDANKITSGTIGSARIPNLAASKITSGTLGTARIPNLDAGKITSGTFHSDRMPDLSATYATASHNHDTRYASISHNHNSSYLSLSGGVIVHSSGTHGLQIYTNSAIPTTEQFKVGRDSGQYYGIRVDDGTARLIHRQDESGTGTHNITSEIWTSTSGGGTWTWRLRDNAGVFREDYMTLNSSSLTVAGTINVENASTNLSQANSAGVLKVTTSHGWTNIGPANSSWSHFDTDRAQFYFNKPTEFNGTVKPYTNNNRDLGSSSKQWNRVYGRYIYQNGTQVLATQGDVHSALYNTGGNADTYDSFGIYRNYGEGQPTGLGHNTVLNVVQRDGNYGWQITSSTANGGDSMWYRQKGTTFGDGTWHQIASRSWVQSQGYGDATQAWVQAQGYITSETDSQTLSWGSGNGQLTISNGNTVDLDGRYMYGAVGNGGDFNDLTSGKNSNFVAFNAQNITDAPNTSWYNGLVTTHSNYLSSYIINEHRTNNWFLGWRDQSQTPSSNWSRIWHSNDFTSTNVTNWNTAYGWGNHSSAGYLTSVPNTLRQGTTLLDTAIEFYDENAGGDLSWVVGADDRGGVGANGQNALVFRYNRGTRFTDTGWRGEGTEAMLIDDSGRVGINTSPANLNERLEVGGNAVVTGTIYANGGNSGQWNQAVGWGNHASAGYLTSESDTLATVVARGQHTAQALIVTAVDAGNPNADANSARLSGYGLLGNRGTFYLTNGGGVVQIGVGATHNANPVATFADSGVSFTRALSVTGNVTADNLNISNWNTAYGWGDHSTAGYMTPIYNGASDNSGKADFAVGVGGNDGAAISLLGNQFQVGGQDINYVFRLDTSGNNSRIKSWERDITLSTDASASSTNVRHIKFATKPSGSATTERVRIDGSGYTYFHGLDLAISNVNSSHGAGNYFRGSSTHLVIGTGGTLHLNMSGSTTVMHGANYYSGMGDRQTNLGLIDNRFEKIHAKYIGSYDAGIFFEDTDAYRCIRPADMSGASANGTISLGWSNNKWKDLYLSGSVNTNSANIQQNVVFPNDSMGIDFYGANFLKKIQGRGMVMRVDAARGADDFLAFQHGADGPYTYAWHSGNLTTASVSAWNTAYGWGNHASAGYLTSVPNHSASLITSGTLDANRLPWASNDGFTGTYPIVWKATGDNRPYTASWLSVNGALDQLNSKAFGSYVGDTGVILQSYNASASNAEQFRIRHNYGSVDIANPRGSINFETSVIVENTLYVGDSVQHWGDGGTGMYFNTDQVDVRTQGVKRIISAGTDGRTYFGSNTNKGYLREFASNTYGSQIGRIARITFTGGFSDWDSDNHAIVSKDINGSMSDSLSVNSYNDVTIRLDSNNNNATSHFYITNDTLGSAMNNRLLDINTGTNETEIATAFVPYTDRAQTLGRDDRRWQIVFCETLDSAGQHESNLQDEEQPISQYATGTVLSWKDGKNRPCTQYADHMRMGIAVEGQDSPLIQGAEPVLVTGIVEEGDYLVTSKKEGHAVAVPRNIVKEQMLFDCVIGKALENGEGESHLIKTWINI